MIRLLRRQANRRCTDYWTAFYSRCRMPTRLFIPARLVYSFNAGCEVSRHLLRETRNEEFIGACSHTLKLLSLKEPKAFGLKRQAQAQAAISRSTSTHLTAAFSVFTYNSTYSSCLPRNSWVSMCTEYLISVQLQKRMPGIDKAFEISLLALCTLC